MNQTNETILSLRLDTDKLLDDIKDYLRGKKTLIKEQDGKIITETIKYGEEQVNDEGFQQLMGFIGSIINPHTAQGNLKSEEYKNLIFRLHKRLAYLVVSNWKIWGIKQQNRAAIVSHLISLTELFLSRTIDNEERKSYGTTLRTIESNTLQTPRNIPLMN